MSMVRMRANGKPDYCRGAYDRVTVNLGSWGVARTWGGVATDMSAEIPRAISAIIAF